MTLIQARMSSTRLYGKVLLPLGDTEVLMYSVARSRSVPGNDETVVATSVEAPDDAIEAWCRERDVPCFRGSEEDVLERFYECAKAYGAEAVIRVTADCPFVDGRLSRELIEKMKTERRDYVSVAGEVPLGIRPEIISFEVLEWLHKNATEPRHREHVTYYCYEYPHKFRTAKVEAPQDVRHPQLRITLDTPEDYEVCRLAAERFRGDLLVPTPKILEYLLAHPDIAAINANVAMKPVK